MKKKSIIITLFLTLSLYSAEESFSSTSNKKVHQFTEKFGWEFEHQNTFCFTGLEWTSDSKYIITSSTDSEIRVWDGFGDVIKSWKFESGCNINAIAASNKSNQIAISYNDKNNNAYLDILNLDITDINSYYTFTVYTSICNIHNFFKAAHNIKKITSICWYYDDKTLIFATSDGSIYASHAEKYSSINEISTFKDAKIDLLTSASKTLYLLSNQVIFYGIGNGNNIYDKCYFNFFRKLFHDDKIFSISFSPNSKYIAYSSGNKIFIKDFYSMQLLNEIDVGDFYPKLISCSPDGTKLAIADNTKIKIFVKN